MTLSEGKFIMDKKGRLVAKELKKKLLDFVPLIDIKVFGSRARGDFTEDSDMDVFIEVETLDKPLKEKIYDIAWEVGFEHSVFISMLIFTRNELENTAMRSSPIVNNIKEEGVPV